MLPNLLKVGIESPKPSRSLIWTGILALAGLMLSANVAPAQPTLQLRFPFDDSSGTTTPSDTSGGGASVTLLMLNKSNASTNLHGVANSGVAGLTNPNRALNLSSNTTQGASGNYAGVTNANLGFGNVSSFAVTMWMKQTVAPAGTILGRMFLLGNGTNTDVGTANSIGMKWQDASHLYFYVNTVQATATFASNLPTNGWIFVAMVYDGSNVTLYEGTETTVATLVSTTATAGQTVPLPGASASLIVGNNGNRNRAFPGWIDDFRFYTGTGGTAAFVESVRLSASGPAGLAAVGTLYGMLSSGLRVRETLLPFLFLPVVAPVLLAGPLRVTARVTFPPPITVPGVIVSAVNVGRAVDGPHDAGTVTGAGLEFIVPPADR